MSPVLDFGLPSCLDPDPRRGRSETTFEPTYHCRHRYRWSGVFSVPELFDTLINDLRFVFTTCVSRVRVPQVSDHRLCLCLCCLLRSVTGESPVLWYVVCPSVSPRVCRAPQTLVTEDDVVTIRCQMEYPLSTWVFFLIYVRWIAVWLDFYNIYHLYRFCRLVVSTLPLAPPSFSKTNPLLTLLNFRWDLV